MKYNTTNYIGTFHIGNWNFVIADCSVFIMQIKCNQIYRCTDIQILRKIKTHSCLTVISIQFSIGNGTVFFFHFESFSYLRLKYKTSALKRIQCRFADNRTIS